MTGQAPRFVHKEPRIPGAGMPIFVQGTEFTRVLALAVSILAFPLSPHPTSASPTRTRRTMLRPLLVVALLGAASVARAQDPGQSVVDFAAKKGGSEKMHSLAHVVSHPGAWKAADIEIEQDRNRPYVYVSGFVNFDAQIYDISNPSAPKKIFDWTIENPELHRGIGAMDGKYFKIGNRYYYAQSYQFMQGGP